MKDPTDIIKLLSLTEKSAREKELANKYYFVVAPSANKLEIKRAVEKLYNVKVAMVNTLVRKGKEKRDRRGKSSASADFKKAIVTLKEGFSIQTV
jgi:large subunit ribosomal protein L23